MILLIVNDEAIIAETTKTEIEWTNYGIDEVYTAYDVCSAKEIIKNNNIDILLCDIEMPRENGLTLIRWIREQELEIECVILTCHAKFAYAQEAVSLRCQDYILLPTQYEDIGNVVYNVVKRIAKRNQGNFSKQFEMNPWQDKIEGEEILENSLVRDSGQIVEEVLAYIVQHIFERGLNVENIASYFHFHPVYLNRIFKKQKDISIRQFIVNERMRIAAQLLKEKRYNVNEVAEKVGYSHYTNFYNMFKKTYKVSPAQYAEEFEK